MVVTAFHRKMEKKAGLPPAPLIQSKLDRSPAQLGGLWSVIPAIAEHMSIPAMSPGHGLRKSVPQVAILLGQVAGVIRMFYTIGVGEFLHPLRIIIISAITATPSCLEAKRVSRGKIQEVQNAYQKCNRHRKPHQANQSDASEKWLGRETQWIRCRKEES
jgi:hypothetical protein